MIDNNDGTVTDTRTNLMWQKISPPGKKTWEQALECCNNLNLGGHSDWRLPNLKELISLVLRERGNPAVDIPVFPMRYSEFHWSSTVNDNKNYAWGMTFSYVGEYLYYKDLKGFYRAVRGECVVPDLIHK